jgi:hypothetical protein
MIKYLEEYSTRKKTSNLLHLSLIVLCAMLIAAYWVVDHHPVNARFLETFKCAVHNAGIGEWKWDTSSGIFTYDEITKSLIGEISTFNDLVNAIDPKDRPLVMKKFYTSSDILVTCKVRGKEVTFSGVISNGVVTGIVHQER